MKLDEQFRVYMSTASNASREGVKIMKEKVFGSTFKRSPSLRTQIARQVSAQRIRTREGQIVLPIIEMDPLIFGPFLIRITKGLLANLYPDFDYFNLRFKAEQLSQFSHHDEEFEDIASQFKFSQRGNGVFRFWHRIPSFKYSHGLWILQFYESAMFIVSHDDYAPTCTTLTEPKLRFS
ncbi:MAG TPA: hypothetical protein VMF06_10450 [Candidatus Limnocylindria bacterium]|jgi:hypothetical protein|nr:hypothetical protein [Candidatus Limnocylindria bacterium]